MTKTELNKILATSSECETKRETNMDKKSRKNACVKNLLFYAEGWKLLYGIKDVQIMFYTGVSRRRTESVEKADVIDVVIYGKDSIERYENLIRKEESVNTIEQKVTSLIKAWGFVDENVSRISIANTAVLRIYRLWKKDEVAVTEESLNELSMAVYPLVYSQKELERGSIKEIKLSLLDENGNQVDEESENKACHVLFEVEVDENCGAGENILELAAVKAVRMELEYVMTEHGMMYTMPFIRVKNTFMCRIARFCRL